MQIRLRTPGGVRAQQLGLDAQDVAVAAAEVQHRLDAGLLLDELAGDLRAHARAGARAVGHVDAVDAAPAAHSRAPSISFAASTPRGGRISTKATNPPAASFAPSLDFSASGTVGKRLRLGGRFLDGDAQARGGRAAASAPPPGSA